MATARNHGRRDLALTIITAVVGVAATTFAILATLSLPSP